MRFANIAACISSLLVVTVSASTPAAFEVPGSVPGTAAAPEVDTTIVFETSTYYLSSAIAVTSDTVNSTAEVTKTGYAPPPVEPTTTSEASLYVTASQTFVPVTLWEGSTTRVIFPQNSTAVEIPTGVPANGTSTVIVTATASSSEPVVSTTAKNKTSATASASASVSQVPVNGAGKVTGSALLGMGIVAGFMALL
ncbi:uncharacterized protein EKO05_0000859 [Ascochyta rabiei]|uniref:Uncharacterized protein n=1 Tax=Didymella rabiei TaxID=5454 RepID=A0A163LSR0_DIDRA|nr:uncharacterized protein EKO05_0000859 [Ascochyta rabiei]KZM28085.1 hypothetical protein ST47_g778 [Ascochyta rabiei]UPX10188.1 hypothetical protein EKO05_0000859 [Ascochyta rabiei]